MADIIQFKKADGSQPHHRGTDIQINPILTPHQILNQAYDDLKSMWDQYAAKNKLNNFIISRIPASSVNLNADYTSDLNAIAELEIKLDMSNHVYFPQHYPKRETQYSSAFGYKMDYYYIEDASFTCEAHSRIMNVILYLEFISRLHKLRKEMAKVLDQNKLSEVQDIVKE
jgi:hypothetical protein